MWAVAKHSRVRLSEQATAGRLGRPQALLAAHVRGCVQLRWQRNSSSSCARQVWQGGGTHGRSCDRSGGPRRCKQPGAAKMGGPRIKWDGLKRGTEQDGGLQAAACRKVEGGQRGAAGGHSGKPAAREECKCSQSRLFGGVVGGEMCMWKGEGYGARRVGWGSRG